MVVKLKICSRILIVFFGLLLITFSSGLIYLHSHAHFAPNAFQYDNVYQYDWSERRFYFDELKNIQISRGFWNIDVIPSDSNFILIQGGMNILNYHLIADQTDTGIILSLSESVKDDHLYEFDAEFYTNSLENIDLNSFANMIIDSAKYDKLNVTLKDEAVLQLKDCEISEIKFVSHNASTLETETCTIGNVSSSMYDSSYAFIFSAESIVYNIQKGYSVLMTYDDKKNFYTHVSDSLLQISNVIPEYVKNLKWLSPFQKPFVYKGSKFGDLDSITYSYSFWDEPKLNLKRVDALSYFYYNSQSISFENEQFFKGIKSEVKLEYSRGLLNSISFTFDNFLVDDSLYSVIMHNIKERFNSPESSFFDSSSYGFENYEITNMSFAPDEAIKNRFEFMIVRNNIDGITSIKLTAPYFNVKDYEFNSAKYRYYHLPFMTYDWR